MVCDEEGSLEYILPMLPPTQGSALTAGMPPAAGGGWGHRCYTLLAIPQMNPCGQDCCWGTLAGKEFQWV